MKIIVGLGNPGDQYFGTRHNAGTMLVDLLARGLSSDYGWRKHFNALIFKTHDLVLVKSKYVFMNESGRLISNFKFQISNLYVAHDDLDIKLGEYKMQKGRGPKVHFGVQSVENVLGTKNFWRIRIGVDNRDDQNRTPGEEYVLQKFIPEEKDIINKVLEKVSREINTSNS